MLARALVATLLVVSALAQNCWERSQPIDLTSLSMGSTGLIATNPNSVTYSDLVGCTWELALSSPPASYAIVITVQSVDLEQGQDFFYIGSRSITSPETYVSCLAPVTVSFGTDGSITRGGVVASYRVQSSCAIETPSPPPPPPPCWTLTQPIELTTSSGLVQSNPPGTNYENDITCTWVISAPLSVSYAVDLTITSLHLEDGGADTLRLTAALGASDTFPESEVLTGDIVARRYRLCNGANLELLTDASIVNTGLQGYFEIVTTSSCTNNLIGTVVQGPPPPPPPLNTVVAKVTDPAAYRLRFVWYLLPGSLFLLFLVLLFVSNVACRTESVAAREVAYVAPDTKVLSNENDDDDDDDDGTDLDDDETECSGASSNVGSDVSAASAASADVD